MRYHPQKLRVGGVAGCVESGWMAGCVEVWVGSFCRLEGQALGASHLCDIFFVHHQSRPPTGRSQHLVAFRGIYIAPAEVAVVTELCLGGTLYTALSDGKVNWYNG